MDNENAQKRAEIFSCEVCDYTCSKKSDLIRHFSTRKHSRITMDNETKMSKMYNCPCGKVYKHSSGLSKHKRNCTIYNRTNGNTTEPPPTDIEPNNTPIEQIDYKTLLVEAMTQMQQQQEELRNKDKLMEKMIDKIGTTNNTTNNNNNTQNNHFNISLFLNEKCKDAINFSDFIERIEISHEDLENNAELGFVNGISKILMDNLNQLTVHERPIHCTDLKRETMYIKDDNEWQKEKETNTQKLNDAIQEVSRKSMISLLDWKKTNPDYKNADSEFSNKCIAMQQQSIAITKKEQYYPKVVHKIAKESAIDKTIF